MHRRFPFLQSLPTKDDFTTPNPESKESKATMHRRTPRALSLSEKAGFRIHGKTVPGTAP
jgi:hypothetical protein